MQDWSGNKTDIILIFLPNKKMPALKITAKELASITNL